MMQVKTTRAFALFFAALGCSHLLNSAHAQAVDNVVAIQTSAAVSEIDPPHPQTVLNEIITGNGSIDLTTEKDDSGWSYWFGHAFNLEGQRYYTGFSTYFGGQDGPVSEAGLVEPGHVAIGQATFTQTANPDGAIWTPVLSDGYIGEFGSSDQADEIDDTRPVNSRETADGRLLLAVPTQRFSAGITSTYYAVFLFDPENADDLSFREWGYLGSVVTGGDNAAMCDAGKVAPCTASTGALSFEAGDHGALPKLKVAFSGTEISGPGEVRNLGPQDEMTYSFDPDEELYLP